MCKLIDTTLRLNESYDLIGRNIDIGGRRATLYFAEGMVKGEMMEKMMEFFLKITEENMRDIHDMNDFIEKYIPNIEADYSEDINKVATDVLSGCMGILIESVSGMCIMDIRTYPVRAIKEPEDDRVLRGAKDGFVETMQFNTAMIRRRIRDTSLTMEIFQVGKKSKTDVVLCYLKGSADEKVLNHLRKKMGEIDVNTLNMGHESMKEALVGSKWYNPFPKARYTQRPDTACAEITEGRIILLIDTTPSAIILPTSLLDFMQETNDYYFPPTVGTYMRIVRLATTFLTLFLLPMRILAIEYHGILPYWLQFITEVDEAGIPVFLQILLIEVAIDGLKLASLNTPSSLNSSFAVVGGLILGDFAVTAGWLAPQVILYAAFVSIANFAQPSYELGYALKMSRMLIFILTAFFSIWGFIIGTAIVFWLMATNTHIAGTSYLSPLIPFEWKKLMRLFLRMRISKDD